jgi:hypothetical protein
MSARPEGNEGLRLLEEFVCEATPAPEVPAVAPPGRGLNTGVQVVVTGDLEQYPGAEPA